MHLRCFLSILPIGSVFFCLVSGTTYNNFLPVGNESRFCFGAIYIELASWQAVTMRRTKRFWFQRRRYQYFFACLSPERAIKFNVGRD